MREEEGWGGGVEEERRVHGSWVGFGTVGGRCGVSGGGGGVGGKNKGRGGGKGDGEGWEEEEGERGGAE